MAVKRSFKLALVRFCLAIAHQILMFVFRYTKREPYRAIAMAMMLVEVEVAKEQTRAEVWEGKGGR